MKTGVIKPNMSFDVVGRLTSNKGRIVVNVKRKEKVDFSSLSCEEKRKVLQALSKKEFLFT